MYDSGWIEQTILTERRRQRRVARRIEAAVVLIVIAAALIVLLAYHPERAGAACSPHRHPCRAQAAFYDHLSVCESTLRGYSSDDDVHAYGVATGAQSFGGWGSYSHYADGSVGVYGRFNYSNSYKWVLGRCSGGDYASDWFE